MMEQFVAEYLRVSIEDGDLILDSNKTESNTISNQRRLIEDYRRKEGLYPELTMIEFTDDGYSGTNFDRPGVRQLLALVREGKICCILVKDISRFGRDYLEVGDYLEQIFPFMGVRFIAVNDGYDSNDYIGTTGGIEIGFKSLLYGMYSKDLSVKMRSALEVRRRRGDFIGPRAPFGYRFGENKKSLVIDQVAARYVRRIFRLACEGYSTGGIATKLNEEGIPTPGAYKNQDRKDYHILDGAGYWDRGKVLTILENKIYLGMVVNGKHKVMSVGGKRFRSVPKTERIYVPFKHEAIVTEQEFLEASQVIKRRGRQNGKEHDFKEESPLLGKLRCGKCGRSLIRVNCTKIPYFTCKRAVYDKECGCMGERIKEPEIEEMVLEQVKQRVRNGVGMRQGLTEESAIDAQKGKRVLLERKKDTLRLEKQRLYEQMRMGEIDEGAYLNKVGRIREEEWLWEGMEDKKDEAGEKRRMEGENAECLTRELVERFVEKIYVYGGGRTEIVWKEKTICI